jgi:hypothetical protein
VNNTSERPQTKLWKDIEWDKFIKQPENVMIWHWSPDHGFSNLPIVGFHEARICYILGVASPTFPIAADTYWDGWVGQNPEYFNHRSVSGVDAPLDLTLGWDYGKPMFTMHYSYMGLDPRRVPLKDGNKFDEFHPPNRGQPPVCLTQCRQVERLRYLLGPYRQPDT